MLTQNQQIIVDALSTSLTTAEARESVIDLLTASQFNAGLGCLKRKGFIEKDNDGNYEIFYSKFSSVEPEVVQEIVKAPEVVVIEPVEEIIEIEPVVIQEAPVVTKKPKKEPKPAIDKPVKMSDDELTEIHTKFMEMLNIKPEFIRVIERIGKSAISTRINKNKNRIKAVESYKAGHYQIFVGKISDELMERFKEIADLIKTPGHAQCHGIVIKFTSDNVSAIKELLGEIAE